MNSYEFTIIASVLHHYSLLTTTINIQFSQIIGSTKKCFVIEAVSDASAATTYELAIEWFRKLSPADLEIARGMSWISLWRAKQLADRLFLNRRFNKSVLVDCIIKKRKRFSDLAAILFSEAADQDNDDGESSRFYSNVNAFPMICGIVLYHADAPICSALLASKDALQDKKANQNQLTLK